MPVNALRSVEAQFHLIIKAVNPKRLVHELSMADKAFHFRHFKGYRADKIGRGRIRAIAKKEIFQDPGHELFANLLIVHWNERKAGLYQAMVTHVKTINEDVEAIEEIENDKANAIIDDLLTRESPDEILLCVRLNGVRFSEEIVQARLIRGESADEALASIAKEKEAAEAASEASTESDAKAEAADTSQDNTESPAEAESDVEAPAATEEPAES